MANHRIPRIDDGHHDEQFNSEMQRLNKIFSQFKDDPDLDCIDVNRLTEVVQAFGRNPSLKDSAERINELELDGKYELTLEDVLQILDEPWAVVNSNRQTLRRALDKFDDTHEGCIDVQQFRIAMNTLGEPLSTKEINEILRLPIYEDADRINIEYLLDQLLGNIA